MSEITSEELRELSKDADEQHALNQLIGYIKNSEYIVMWVDENSYHPLANNVYDVDDELKVYLGGSGEYIDLYSVNMEDIKVYKEINFID